MSVRPPGFAVFGRSSFDRGLHVWHHVARRLAKSHDVLYVQDPARMGWSRVGPTITRREDDLLDMVPVDYPLQRFGAIRRACLRNLASAAQAALPDRAGGLVCILYPRSCIDSALALAPDLIVYHATDDFSYTWEGKDDRRFAEWEARALSLSDLVVATQEALGDRFVAAGHPRVLVQTLGFDELVFDGRPRDVPQDLRSLARPILGYAGNVYAAKVDVPLLTAAARARPQWSFVFVGEVFDDDSGTLAALSSLPNVHLLGLRKFIEVPAYVHAFDVAIHPQRRDPRGRPFTFYALKVFDALSMGRPIVLTPGSPLTRLLPHAVYTDGLEEFLRAIERALEQSCPPDVSRSRAQAVANDSWGRKVGELLHAVDAVLHESSRSGPSGLGR